MKCPECGSDMSRDHEKNVFYCEDGHDRVERKATPVDKGPDLTLDRPTLRSLRTTAEGECSSADNPMWKRAYTALADAADRLDSMMARTEDQA